MLRLEQMQALLKTEPEDTHNEVVDVVTVTPSCQKLKVKEEEQEADVEPKFFLGPCVSAQFVGETAQQVRCLEVKMCSVVSLTEIEKKLCLFFSFYLLFFSDWGKLSAIGGGEECVRSCSGNHDSEGQSVHRPKQEKNCINSGSS